MSDFRRTSEIMRLLAPVALLGPIAVAGCVPKKAPGAASSTAVVADPAHNLIKNADFNDGTSLPWTPSFPESSLGDASVVDQAYCLHVKGKGENPWDVQIRHREMTIQKGHTYTINFKVWASAPTKIRAKLGMSGPPYFEYWREDLSIGTQPQTITGQFTMNKDDDRTAEFAIHAGANLAIAPLPFDVCIDDVVLSDPQFTAPPKVVEAPPPNVRVNQVGYLPTGRKLAVIVNASTTPLKWQLLDAQGQVLLSGDTIVVGPDAMAGEPVHVADFSAYQTPGEGFTLSVGTDASYPFKIAADIYQQMKYDAMKYFYHNRSGIPIEMPYAVDQKWTRPAGHLTSDKAVSCGADIGCDYKLDVTGGWYDAGDHGKYVVNGGISVWTLLDMYERAQYLGGDQPAMADKKLNIPESGNNVPDVLDEVRWELEFMLKMQVPERQPKAGMVHHKIHDVKWTALGVAPHEAEQKMQRHLRAPSTAATLNLAAVGAMCSRIYRKIDAAFADKCLQAAERAWRAAEANPSIYAQAKDTNGGGPYHDEDVTDDFYWAASELFITTGREEFRTEITASPHHNNFPMQAGGASSSMTWERTDALGKISLAVVPNKLGDAAVKALRAQITGAADQYLKMIDETGYRVPFKGAADGKYPWGSNSFMLNNMVILALSHDFAKSPKYFDGVTAGMGYLMGRNPLSQCYVTGYGERPLRHPHHRFWAHQVDSRFPVAPPGAISGGPNSGLEDPYVQAAGLQGCAPQKCFVDHIEAWSANEITINWNAPFAWLLFYLDEAAQNGQK